MLRSSTLDDQEIQTLDNPPTIDMNDLDLRHKNRLRAQSDPGGGGSRCLSRDARTSGPVHLSCA